MSKKNTNIKRFVWPFPSGKNGLRGTNDKFLRIIIDYDKMEVYRQKPRGKDNWHKSDIEKFESLTQEELINFFPKRKTKKTQEKKTQEKTKKIQEKRRIKVDESTPTPEKKKNEIVNKSIFNDCEAILELIKNTSESKLRFLGLVFLIIGFLIIWYIKS